MHEIAALAGYKVVAPRKVAWGDMDAMRHVNNTKYFYYCEAARLEFLDTLLPNGEKLLAQEQGAGIALAETACRFKVSLSYPDDILIGSAISKIEDTQFEISHAIYSHKLDLIAAQATARMVYFDFSAGKRAQINASMRTKLEEFSL